MARVATPLARVGARVIVARDGGRLPLAIIGAATPLPITYRLPVPSAQVKSAVLLAGLNAPGETIVDRAAADARPQRAHAAPFRRERRRSRTRHDGGRRITLKGQPELAAADLSVPGDPSSAAFPAVAALLVPGSEITIEGVGVNPLRAGLYDTLAENGRRHRLRQRARRGRRAGRRSRGPRQRAAAASRCRPSARRA